MHLHPCVVYIYGFEHYVICHLSMSLDNIHPKQCLMCRDKVAAVQTLFNP